MNSCNPLPFLTPHKVLHLGYIYCTLHTHTHKHTILIDTYKTNECSGQQDSIFNHCAKRVHCKSWLNGRNVNIYIIYISVHIRYTLYKCTRTVHVYTFVPFINGCDRYKGIELNVS